MAYEQNRLIINGLLRAVSHERPMDLDMLRGHGISPAQLRSPRLNFLLSDATEIPGCALSPVIDDVKATARCGSDDAVSLGVVRTLSVLGFANEIDWIAIYVTEDRTGRTGNA